MKRFVFILLLLISTDGWAEWTRVGGDDEIATYADLGTKRRRGNMVKMWVLFNYKTAQQADAGMPSYLSMIAQNEYDCDEERYRNLYFSMYSENMGGGRVVASNSEPTNWTPISPTFVISRLWKTACKH